MATELPFDRVPELVPLNWLIGSWEGQGRLGEGDESAEIFYQRIDFIDHGMPFLEYRSEAWICEADATLIRPLTLETGFWALDRDRTDSDVGPGMIPGDIVPAYASADDVEKLRLGEDKGFPITASITHPGSMTELYYGVVRGPQVELKTDAVLRTDASGSYDSATRMYGLVNGQMFWRWDVSPTEADPLAAHASAILDRLPDTNSGRLKPGLPHTPGKHDL